MTQTIRRELRQKADAILLEFCGVLNELQREYISGKFADAALEVRGIAMAEKSLPPNSDLSWQLASGASAEEIAASNAKDAEELALLMHYESKMGYGTTLDWWGKNADLIALRKFLVTQTREDIDTFAKWCKRLYSKFKPEDAVRFPRNVMTFWPMAFEETKVEKTNDRSHWL